MAPLLTFLRWLRVRRPAPAQEPQHDDRQGYSHRDLPWPRASARWYPLLVRTTTPSVAQLGAVPNRSGRPRPEILRAGHFYLATARGQARGRLAVGHVYGSMARSGDDTEIDPAAEVMAAIADVIAGCAYLRRRAGQLSVSVLVAAAGKSMRALGGPRSSPGSRHRCQLASLSSRAAETGG